MKQLVQLHKDIDDIKAAGINLVGISYDSVEKLKAFSDRNKLSYPLLSDEGSVTIDAMGIRNKEMDGKKFGPNDLTGIPYPGTYILDKEGIVTAKIFLEGYTERHTTEALIEAVNGAGE